MLEMLALEGIYAERVAIEIHYQPFNYVRIPRLHRYSRTYEEWPRAQYRLLSFSAILANRSLGARGTRTKLMADIIAE